MNTMEFFTKDQHYMIAEDGLWVNGELVVSGKVSFHHLIMGERAILIHERNERIPQTFITTDFVTEIPAGDEYYGGKKCGRNLFHVSFKSMINDKWVQFVKDISAVNEQHMRNIIKRTFHPHMNSLQVEKP